MKQLVMKACGVSIDTVLLWLAVALCVGVLALMGGAAAGLAAIGIVGAAVARGAPPTCPACGGAGTVASDEPFMMMAAVPCPTCSPLVIDVARAQDPLEHPPAATDPAETAAGDARAPRFDVRQIPIAVDPTMGFGEWKLLPGSSGLVARAPLDLAALRTLAREAMDEQPRCYACNDAARGVWASPDEGSDDTSASLSFLCSHHGIPGANDGGTILPNVPALAVAVEQLCDALEARGSVAPARLGANELAIVERARALVRDRDAAFSVFAEVGVKGGSLSDHAVELVEKLEEQRRVNDLVTRERDELRASVALLDEKGREMKAERDAALAQIERMKPVIEAAKRFRLKNPSATPEYFEKALDALDGCAS